MIDELFINFLKYLKIEKNYSKYTIINYGKDLKTFKKYLDIEHITNIKKIDYKVLRQYLSFLYEFDYEKKTVILGGCPFPITGILPNSNRKCLIFSF